MKSESQIFAFVITAFISVDAVIWLAMSFISMGCSNEGYLLANFCINTNGTTFHFGTSYQETFFSPVAVVAGGLIFSLANFVAVWAVDTDHILITSSSYTKPQVRVLISLPVIQFIYIIIMLGLAGGNGSLQLWGEFPMTTALTGVWMGMITIRILIQVTWTSVIISKSKWIKKE